jgi:hypothetical protein
VGEGVREVAVEIPGMDADLNIMAQRVLTPVLHGAPAAVARNMERDETATAAGGPAIIGA